MNCSDDGCAPDIASALAQNRTLLSLNLSIHTPRAGSVVGACIGPSGCVEIAKSLGALVELEMSQNSIGDTGATSIASAICHTKTLKTIRLGTCIYT